MKIFQWILVGCLLLITIFFGYQLGSIKKVNKDLKNQIENNFVKIDSLQKSNKHYQDSIIVLYSNIKKLDNNIDSLKNIKHEIVKEKFIISKNTSEAISVLRNNILCEN